MFEPAGECPCCGADIAPADIDEPCWDCGHVPGEDCPDDEEDYDELDGRDDYKDYPPEGSGRSDEYFRERD